MKRLQLEWKALRIDQYPHDAGHVVGEGSGKFRIRGERVQPLRRQQCRFVVHAPSKPGMSGLPLFQGKGDLVSLVHGDSKHRAGHKVSEDDRPSPFLYADSLPVNLELFQVKNEFAEVLLQAEQLSSEIAHETPLPPNHVGVSEEYRDFSIKFGESLGMVAEEIETTSVNTMMKNLAKSCFVDAEPIQLKTSVMVASKQGELVDESSKGHASEFKKPMTPSPVRQKRQQTQQAGEQP